ncbi:MAG TPA: PAS domain S-box protein, partial [Prolixibacteraceae bacterium]
GQFFLEKPDKEYFREQTSRYSFDESAYLAAVEKVPVWSHWQLDIYLTAISSMIDILVSIGSKKLKEIETRKTIQENEERFKNLFETAPDAIFLADIETGIIIDANYAASRLLGKPVAEIIGMHHLHLHPERIEQHTKETFHEHVKSGNEPEEGQAIDNVVVNSDGIEIPVEILSSTVMINGKRIIQGVFRNMTSQKKTENKLKESEEKYSLTFHTSPDSVNINSLDGTYVDINDGFTSLMGYSKEEIIGRSSLDLNIWVIPEDRQKMIAGLQKEGRVENLESVFRAKDGSFKTALMSASLIKINNIPHILSITRDISDRKIVETDLVRAKEKAEESDRLKSAFLSNLSHELRTPMNGILGFSELLDDDSLTTEERHEYVSVINDSGLSLLEVITNIMDLSKIDSQQIEIKTRTFNLNSQLDELMKWFRSEKIIKDKSHLKVELKKALPDEQSNLTTDQGKIRHIFSLLLNNAAKFTSEGKIQFGYFVQEQNIKFFVKDTGKGIPADKHDAIFERFRQEEETLTRKYGGAGLGLAIAKGLVELMSGKIWVESEPGKGSTFWFEIPLL